MSSQRSRRFVINAGKEDLELKLYYKSEVLVKRNNKKSDENTFSEKKTNKYWKNLKANNIKIKTN